MDEKSVEEPAAAAKPTAEGSETVDDLLQDPFYQIGDQNESQFDGDQLAKPAAAENEPAKPADDDLLSTEAAAENSMEESHDQYKNLIGEPQLDNIF